jgi:HTH-type transcriptional regulator, transcriptional repressor of NAD biosynthesis genes
MTKYRTGVVVGKFWPPHLGHHFLIDAAAARCDRLTVIVAWRPDQDLAPALRAECLRECHPGVEVLVVEDTVPADDSVGWAGYTVRILGGAPDAAFTSEGYGDAWAGAMGADHVCVDRPRANVPCSATMIRADPLAHLAWLSPFMRAVYVRRVCIVGAESTGTTTLAADLAGRYGTAWVPEYGREHCERKWRHGWTSDWTGDEFVHIAREQCRREDEAARRANRLLVCDTDAFATALWHRRYLQHRHPVLEALAAERRADLYLLTGDEVPFVQDGTRDGEAIRGWMHRAFAQELEATGRRWALLRGPREERLAHATTLVDELLREPVRPRAAGVPADT